MAGAGACHSDVAIFHEFDEGLNPQMDQNSPWATKTRLGRGARRRVKGIELGAAYLVYGPVGCGICRACTRGQDTYCENADRWTTRHRPWPRRRHG